MKSQSVEQDLWKDYLELAESYHEIMKPYEFRYLMIQFSVKWLMDSASRHTLALETIKSATEEGIKWHVEERGKNG